MKDFEPTKTKGDLRLYSEEQVIVLHDCQSLFKRKL